MRVNIAKPFTLTHQDGTPEDFVPGAYELPDELANHWYVQAHSNKEPEVRRRAVPGTPAYEQRSGVFNHQDSIDDAAMQQEMMESNAAIRRKFEEGRVDRQRRRSLSPEVRRRIGEEMPDDEEVDPGEQEVREMENAERNPGRGEEARQAGQSGDRAAKEEARAQAAQNGPQGRGQEPRART